MTEWTFIWVPHGTELPSGATPVHGCATHHDLHATLYELAANNKQENDE